MLEYCHFLAVCLVLFVSPSNGLTDDEVSKFKTTGITETNTGKIGWVSVETDEYLHILSSNGIPDHETGEFPSDSNPNRLREQDFQISVPKRPVVADTPACLPRGPIGIAVNGVPIFNIFNADGEDATKEGEFDECDGHPDQNGVYHYQQQPRCLINRSNDTAELIGVAIDGFPIYGQTDELGSTITSADLDVCNGRYVNGRYQYHVIDHYPHVLGCFKGISSEYNRRDSCYYSCNKEGLDKDTVTPFCDKDKQGDSLTDSLTPPLLIPDRGIPLNQLPNDQIPPFSGSSQGPGSRLFPDGNYIPDQSQTWGRTPRRYSGGSMSPGETPDDVPLVQSQPDSGVPLGVPINPYPNQLPG